MKNSISTKRLAKYTTLCVFAIFCVVMLAFSTIYLSDELTNGHFDVKPDNGFKWMSFKSSMLGGDTWDIAKVPIAILSIAQLVFGLGAIATIVYNFVSNKDDSNKKIIIGGLVSMTLYAIEGIVVRSGFLEESSILEDYVLTAAYLPLIIGVVLLIGYYAIDKFMSDDGSIEIPVTGVTVTATTKTSNACSAVNESERIESLSKYKKLLDEGIITQEEFDAKKKQLLNL